MTLWPMANLGRARQGDELGRDAVPHALWIAFHDAAAARDEEHVAREDGAAAAAGHVVAHGAERVAGDHQALERKSC